MRIVPNFNDVKINTKDLLPERDYDKNKAGIVSQVVGAPVSVEYKARMNCAYKTKKGYTVVKASPKAKGIDGNTAINHELAHILFNSFEDKVMRTLKAWSKEWVKDNNDDSGSAFQTYHEALNIIEDQRIESLWGKLYLGNVKEFVNTRKKLGADLKEHDHPSNILLAERFYRPDLITGKYAHVAKMLHEVEGKDLDASLIVLKKVKPYLDEIIKKLIDSRKRAEKARNDINNIDASDPNKEKKINDIMVERNTAVKEIQETSPIKHDDHRDDMVRNQNFEEEGDIFKDDELTDGALRESEERAMERLKDIKDKMSGASQMPQGNTSIRFRQVDKSMKPNKETYNVKTVAQIKRLIKTFKEKQKDVISPDGDELDVGEYIDMKANGYGECMIEPKNKHGLSICVSIDGSGSMAVHNPVVENIMTTLWKSIEGLDSVDLNCITWASDREGNISLRRFGKNDINYLGKQRGGFTPTHIGIKVGSEELSRMKGNRKLLIVITDGFPNYFKKGVKVRRDVSGKEAVKALKLSMRKTPNVMILGIGQYLGFMKEMFGNKFIICKGMYDVENFMMNKFKKELIQVMRK